MAVLSRVRMNKARHREGIYSVGRKEAKEKEKEWAEKHKETPEERDEREKYILNVLGLKGHSND